MPELHARIGALEAEVKNIISDLDELDFEVRGEGNRYSLRRRLQRLENDRLAARAARTALAEAVAARSEAQEAKRLQGERKWTRRQTVIATIGAAAVFLPSLILPWVNLYLSLRR